MFTLVKHQVADDLIETVNARELHAFLDSGQQFGNWITNRIDQYGFIENQDYCTLNKIIKRATGATNVKEYHITLDMAKELSMVERNAKGKQARQYFIECERRMVSSTPRLPQNFSEALRMLADTTDAKLALELKIEHDAPMLTFAESVTDSSDVILMRDMAKLLQSNGYNIGQNQLFAKLQFDGYLLSNNTPSQRAMNLGLFKVIESTYTQVSSSGTSKRINLTTKVTGKGQVYLINKYCHR